MSAGAALLTAGRRLLAAPWLFRLAPAAPRAGLLVTDGGLRLRLADATGTERQWPLPAALQKLDGLHPNCSDERAFNAELLALLSNLPAAPLALLLPTRYFRAFTLEMDSLPRSRRELDSILRFRLKRLLPYKTEAARLSYRTIEAGGAQPARLFVLAGYEPVLRQWEQALAASRHPAAWLLPASLATLAAAPAPGILLQIDHDNSGINLVAARAGAPILIRSKQRLAEESPYDLAARETAVTLSFLREKMGCPRLDAARLDLPDESSGHGSGNSTGAMPLAAAPLFDLLTAAGCARIDQAGAPLDWIAVTDAGSAASPRLEAA